MVDDFVEAERVYMHVVQNKPYDPASYLNLGLCRCSLLSGISHSPVIRFMVFTEPKPRTLREQVTSCI